MSSNIDEQQYLVMQQRIQHLEQILLQNSQHSAEPEQQPTAFPITENMDEGQELLTAL
jgi:hypothetical protein